MQATNESEERSGSRVDVTRGVIVIVLAIAVGAFVVTQGLNDDDESAAASDVAAVGGSGEDGLESDPVAGDGSSDTTEGIGGATAEAGDGGTDTTLGGGDAAAGDEADGDADSDADTMNDSGDGSAGDGGSVAADDDPAGPATQEPADVTVLVLNGAGAKGIAGRGSAILQEAGYDVLAPRNATFLGPSRVLYTEGFDDEAAAVAATYDVDPAAVVAPLDPSDPPISDTRGADVIVVVGEDGLIQV